MTNYYASKNAIRTAHHVDGRTLEKWLSRPDWPHFVKGKGWAVAQADAVVLKLRQAQVDAVKGANADLKREKLLHEIERIKQYVRLQKIEGDRVDKLLLPMDEHLDDLRTFAGWVKDAFALWISNARVLTGDARVLAEAERLRDQCFERMREHIEADKSQTKKDRS